MSVTRILIFVLILLNTSVAQQAKLMFTFGHTSPVSYALFSPDGKKISTISFDKTGKIWDVASGQVLADLKGNTSLVYTEEFSPDGKQLLNIAFDNLPKVWDVVSGELLFELKGHRNQVWGGH